MRMMLAVISVLVLTSCDRRKPPSDDQQFNRMMSVTRQFYNPVLKVYACNRSEFGTHAKDKKDHLAHPQRESIRLKLDEFDAGQVDPTADATAQERSLMSFKGMAGMMIRFPKREGEDQLYRKVEIDADPEVPDHVLLRLEAILKNVGALSIHRIPR